MLQFLFKIIYIFLITVVIALLTGCSSIFSPEKKYEAVIKDAPFDVIIVPGFPHEKDNWSIVVKSRVYWALYLYQNGIAKNIIFSGAAVYTPYIEAEVMALYAEALGIPKKNIFVETQAEHSCENLYYSYLIAKQKGFQSIAVATDVIQCGLIKKFKRKFNLYDVKLIPIVYDDLAINEKPDPTIDVDTAISKNFISIRKRENFFQRYRGTQGYKVKKIMREEAEESDECLSIDRHSKNKSEQAFKQ